ncbi:DNA helicase-2/ATP-dependent DNA helicase PcrA [Halanaerobium saccharolyticum]|jgi:DNA helicase-2/ATP-dependent DNA helicase PcrA|uniref:DNA 3'-5' helicase n=1 Tax=Halanaerobium saccharolyticum TaxID=43595 RepID=A0A2T5RIY2_9FIRM|nr:ATP-dependent helicase [Halanaerobium saccharolyticum]PTV98372.1 DNA helicase-2/ATP-dependent DNA helicase PcrA [Halanaerobium saccharolyticum]
MITPTKQQKEIINEKNNIVVIAKPGSGKTYVLSKKIRKILPEGLDYKGVIAISYTNKASDELKNRCLKDGLDKKASFFGTIHNFLLVEIIIPFGKQIFGLPNSEIKVDKQLDELYWITDLNYKDLTKDKIDCLKNLFIEGLIGLESIGLLALYIYDNSLACRNYLKARYTHIIIDEYQDSSLEQHLMFLRLKDLGLKAIAVGDIDQSIYAYSGKKSKYLESLASEEGGNDDFEFYPLTVNHRCHPSIVNYSARLLNKKAKLITCEDVRVFDKKIIGLESNIADWLSVAIPYFSKKFDIDNNKKFAVLVRSNRTGKIIDNSLVLEHKFFTTTDLDKDINRWSIIFRRLLYVLFDDSKTKIGMLEDFIDFTKQKNKLQKLIDLMKKLEELVSDISSNFKFLVDYFIKIAEIIYPNNKCEKSISLIKETLKDPKSLDVFKPAKESEVQIMTIHKSKGLEFDVVFHLDLYEWILPSKRIKKGEKYYPNPKQDINLHYVGITRARKASILCTSTKRHNYKNDIKNGNPSEFFKYNKLYELRNTVDI